MSIFQKGNSGRPADPKTHLRNVTIYVAMSAFREAGFQVSAAAKHIGKAVGLSPGRVTNILAYEKEAEKDAESLKKNKG